MTFHLIPHTHWDREWYLPRAAFQARLIPVLDAVLDQLERDDTARFVLDGQTVLLEDYLAVRPDAVERIAACVQLGALEVGPWYVLSDLLIPTGESLIRNLAEGARDAKRFGRRLNVLYSPDAFGHPAALPSLAAQFGIRFGVVRRGLGRPTGADHDLYRWDGPDGAQLLVYHLPKPGYEVAIDLTRPELDPETVWRRIRVELADRALTDQIAVFLGADHHPAPDLAALRDRLMTSDPDHEIRESGLSGYFCAVTDAIREAPVVRGELRRIDGHTWILQGVHGTRARQKRRHGEVELVLSRVAEPLAALAGWRGGRDRRGELRVAWRTLLQSQFHDTLCGSCADPVAREQSVRLHSVEVAGREIAIRSLHELAGHDSDAARRPNESRSPRLVLWNPCARDRSGIITAELTFFRRDVLVGPAEGRTGGRGPGHRPFALQSSSGERIPVQVLALRQDDERIDPPGRHPDQAEVDRVFVAFRAPSVPGLGLRLLGTRASRNGPAPDALEVHSDRLVNRYLDLRFSNGGGLTIRDRSTGQEYSRVFGIEDEPDQGDSYTFSRGSGRVTRPGRPVRRKVLARGPLVGAIESRWSLRSAGSGRVHGRLVVTLDADSPIVRLRLDLENRARHHRLRARFPVGAGAAALAGAPFGAERREPALPATGKAELERYPATAPAQRFVSAGAGDRGLTILAPGFFEYEWSGDQSLCLTLLRAVGELSRGDLPERPGHAGWPTPTPLAQELGSHTIRLALATWQAEDSSALERLERFWEEAFLPIQALFLRDAVGASAPTVEGATLEGEGLVFTAAKPASSGDGLVLRCYNTREAETAGRWESDRPLARAVRIRADETELGELGLSPDRRTVGFTARPREIVTVRLHPAAPDRPAEPTPLRTGR